MNKSSFERPLTVSEILDRVSELKPITRVTLYRQMEILEIKPVGARQCPQLYPADTAERILERYGFATAKR